MEKVGKGKQISSENATATRSTWEMVTQHLLYVPTTSEIQSMVGDTIQNGILEKDQFPAREMVQNSVPNLAEGVTQNEVPRLFQSTVHDLESNYSDLSDYSMNNQTGDARSDFVNARFAPRVISAQSVGAFLERQGQNRRS